MDDVWIHASLQGKIDELSIAPGAAGSETIDTLNEILDIIENKPQIVWKKGALATELGEIHLIDLP